MRHVVELKFWTNLLIARLAAPLTRNGGSMTFTSGSGVRAQEASASYVANQALAAMVQGLGSELGPRVRINVVAPAFMDTALWRSKPRGELDTQDRTRLENQSPRPSWNAGGGCVGLRLPHDEHLCHRSDITDRRWYDASKVKPFRILAR